MSNNSPGLIFIERLSDFFRPSLMPTGMPQADDSITADAIVTACSQGVTNGTQMLIGDLQKQQKGGYQPTAVPGVVPEDVGSIFTTVR